MLLVSHHMIALKAGKLMKQGTPDEVMTSETLRSVFEIEAQIVPCPVNCKPICLTYDLAMISNQLRKRYRTPRKEGLLMDVELLI